MALMLGVTAAINFNQFVLNPFKRQLCDISEYNNMIQIGLIREGKVPADNRVALTPAQCKWINETTNQVRVIVQSSATRCFNDKEYQSAGIEVEEDVSDCDILLGIKEVPVDQLIPNKIYL